MGMSRRAVLKAGSLAIGSLLLPLSGSNRAALFSQSLNPPEDGSELNDWIWVDRSGRVVVGVSQCEVGQGIYTGLAEVAAAEMDADWAHVTVKFVTGRDAYRQVAGGESFAQFVAASTSMTKFYQRVRLAGAQARDLFLRAGAVYFDAPVSQCVTQKGRVVDTRSMRSVGYGDLLSYAVSLPLNPSPALKSAAEEAKSLIGKEVQRVDTPEKVDGSAIFGIDVSVADMLIGVPWMVPALKGHVVKIKNEAYVRSIDGVVDLVQTHHLSMNNMMGHDPDQRINTIVVVAQSYWQAKKAADLLDVEFVIEAAHQFSSQSIAVDNQTLLQSDSLVDVVSRGDAKSQIQGAIHSSNFHEARYDSPYVAHATMEPCNATSHYQDGRIETWGPFQGQDMVRNTLAKVFALKPSDVVVNTTFLGGSFGRKYLPDAVLHATLASKAVGRPVKVIYPREIDIRHEYYRPSCISHFQAVLGDDGYPQALWARYAGQSLFWQMRRQTVQKAGGWDESMVECLYNTSYALPNLHVEAGICEQPISLSYLRGVGSVSSLFFMESFISELAHKAGLDEYQYRRRLLAGYPEVLRVLDAVALASDWGGDLPAGQQQGLALNIWVGREEAFTTYVALVAQVEVKEDRFKVVRVVCAVDCGKVINPNLVRANIEGGIGFGLSTALKSNVRFVEGAVIEGNFDTYALIKISDMPDIKVVILDSDRPPQGCGEVSTAVLAPAIASALHKVTGAYYRSLPFPSCLSAVR